jgi:ectoine hydroxylase-related dioxygenase (phytanoyl-CoA dioxygenase family)
MNALSLSMQIKEQGYAIVKNYLSEEQANSLKAEMVKAYEKIPDGRVGIYDTEHFEPRMSGDFDQGKSILIYPPTYKHFKYMSEYFFGSEFINTVVEKYYGGRCNKFLQTYSTYESNVVDNSELDRHSWMHVDPYQALKVAFFPLGSTIKSGALRVIPNSRQEGSIIRQQFMSQNPKGLRGGIAHRMVDFREHCPTLITRNEDEAIYLECSPTDICFLDTDTYHGGGLVTDNNLERMAFFIHNRLY